MPYENNEDNEDKFIKAVSKRITKLRTDKRWSQEKLAEKMCVERKSISRYETGKTEMSIYVLAKYVKIFNVSPNYILFGNDTDMISKRKLIDYIMKN